MRQVPAAMLQALMPHSDTRTPTTTRGNGTVTMKCSKGPKQQQESQQGKVSAKGSPDHCKHAGKELL